MGWPWRKRNGRFGMPVPPANAGFMVAAYVVAAVILVGYTLWLYAKGRRS